MAEDPLRYFRVEAAELAEKLGRGALDLGKGAEPAGGVAALLRHAHTLKGAARVVKQLGIAEHAHGIEDLLEVHRGGGAVPRETVDGLLSHVDGITLSLKTLDGPVSPDAAVRSAAVDEPQRTLRADLGEVDGVLDRIAASRAELEGLRTTLGALEHARQLGGRFSRTVATPRRADARRAAQALEGAQSLAAELEESLKVLDRDFRVGLERLGRELAQAHGQTDRLRLVPAASAFTALERAARDAARDVGREIAFVTSGGEVRLDGDVLSAAQQGLLHVVRNAVVHGIEPPEQRTAAGKPRAGTIRLGVARAGREILFSCQDDGRGLDSRAVRRALRQAGLADTPDDDALLARLLAGGISTAQGVTPLSGRGVGLDVVRASVERVGGSARLATEAGRGFRVELRVPITAMSLLGLALECGGRVFTLPLDSVVESARIRSDAISRSASGEHVSHGGRVIPFAPLARAMRASSTPERDSWSAVFVESATGTAAIGVDRLLGARTVALRLLPELAQASAVVAGASLDSLGNPELVLDPDGLVAEVQRLSSVAPQRATTPLPILVVDDSLTTRMLEQSILESAGYEVELASSGEEGLEKARARRYALFLVDVEMPGIDGFTFVERASKDPTLGKIPAVLVSSRSAPEDIARGAAAGARAHVDKGRFDQRELLVLIQRLIGAG
jgi:two-component system, chemotaxis family, sensor kinase CheA